MATGRPAEEDVGAAGPGPADGEANIEIRIAARPSLIPVIRTVASDLAARADFDLDAISDLRMAVDEACAVLLGVAEPDSTLICVFAVLPDRIEVRVTVPAPADLSGDAAAVPTNTFGWWVLHTLADTVDVLKTPAGDDGPARMGIRLDKRAITDSG